MMPSYKAFSDQESLLSSLVIGNFFRSILQNFITPNFICFLKIHIYNPHHIYIILTGNWQLKPVADCFSWGQAYYEQCHLTDL